VVAQQCAAPLVDAYQARTWSESIPPAWAERMVAEFVFAARYEPPQSAERLLVAAAVESGSQLTARGVPRHRVPEPALASWSTELPRAFLRRKSSLPERQPAQPLLAELLELGHDAPGFPAAG
jgi:hypothetical protein